MNLADMAFHPAGMDPTATIRVIVEVEGDSVASAEGDAADSGVAFTPADEAGVRAEAAEAQARVADAVTATGGEVERTHVDAINAMTVTIAADQLETLAANPDVVKVSPVRTYTLDNGNSNAFTGTPAAWEAYGTTGAGVKLAIIDDGIDYTHADFGGSGDPADFAANDGTVIEPGTFPTPKVVAGYDFVGDDYDASSDDPALTVPHPDPDPLACGEHGTHVSGTAGGQGVLLDGSTFTGPYDSSIDPANFLVSPGSAPEASLMMYRVFGCAGSVDNDVLLAAIDRAVADGADVINMSLGSTWGYADDPDAVAADNAVRSGVVVVVSAGNSGHVPYLVGGPSTAPRVLSVAAVDAIPGFPGAIISGGGESIEAINANNGPLPVTGTLAIVRNTSGGISLGCSVADFPATPPAPNTIYAVERGVCARVDKALYGQQAGAVAVIQINTAAGFPPFEGPIPGVTIPYLGVSSEATDALEAIDGTEITIDPIDLANPTYSQAADFTSGGPRSGDGGQKPDIAAPGVSVVSAFVGSGTQSVSLSGTSMAAPHTAGIAALAVQAHPTWRAEWIKTALVNTARASAIDEFDTRLSGNGLVDPLGAIATDTVLLEHNGQAAVNFGFEELDGSFHETERLVLENTGTTPATYNLAPAWNSDSFGATVTVTPNVVTVAPGDSARIRVRLDLGAAAAAALPAADQTGDLLTVRGQIVATPTTDDQPLSVPFILVPHSRSEIKPYKVSLGAPDTSGLRQGQITVRNRGFVEGTADVYEWVLSDGANPSLDSDSRAIGVQSFPVGATDAFAIFAFSTYGRFAAPTEDYQDAYLDTDDDGLVDHELLVVDSGLYEAGSPNGVLATYVFDLTTGDGFKYPAIAAADGSVVLGLAFASDFGITAASPPAVIVAQSISLGDGVADVYDGYGTINLFDPQLSAGDYFPVAAKAQETFPIAKRPAYAGEVPAKGWMIVTLDDEAGAEQANLVPGP